MIQNHVVSPNIFFDAVEEFAFNYDWFVESTITVDKYGDEKINYQHLTIRGSLQSQGTSLDQSTNGNTENMQYKFYCMSYYRIKIGDFILYKNRYLRVNQVQDYDEWGVRESSLTMINLNNYKDLQESVKYLNGEKII